ARARDAAVSRRAVRGVRFADGPVRRTGPDKAGQGRTKTDKKGGQGRTRPDLFGVAAPERDSVGRFWPVRLSCPALSWPCPPFLSVFVRPCPALSAFLVRLLVSGLVRPLSAFTLSACWRAPQCCRRRT